MVGAGDGTTGPTPARLALRLVIGATLFAVAGFVGRTTVIDGGSLAMIWPAAGIAGLWLGSGTRRTAPFDIAALAAVAFAINTATGSTPALGLVLVATNVAQAVAFVALVRAWIPGLWGFGGREPLQHLRDLGHLAAAAVLGCLLGALVGSLGVIAVLGGTDVASFAVWWGRNSVATVIVAALGVLAGFPLRAASSPREVLALALRACAPRSTLRALEGVALVVVSGVLYLLLFVGPSAGPLLFLVLAVTVWAGVRFEPLTVLLHGAAMGAAGLVLTLRGVGPFSDIESLDYRALVAQVFVAMAVLMGLALSFSRVERNAAIRELAEARQAADERAQLLDAVLESMKEGVVVVGEGDRVLVANTASRVLAGLLDAQDHIRPAAAYGLFHDNGLPLTDEEMANTRALAGETVAPFDIHVRTEALPGGRILEVSGQPLSPAADGSPRAMVNLRDVTLDRQHRDTLASFAGVVAHDLLNPLSIVDGWTEALSDEFSRGPVSPSVGGVMVTRIQRSTAHMRDFIADLMSYTIARDQSLRPGPVDLTDLVRSLATMRGDGPAAPLIEVEDGLQVWADPGLVRQLLDNLLGNAVKYVEPGRRPVVHVTGATVGDQLEIRVSDNGIGIPEPDREAIFESFHRAHTDRFGGTGLGLAICRRIVDRHGGTIHVVPGPQGVGSTFVLRLPRLAESGSPQVPLQARASS